MTFLKFNNKAMEGWGVVLRTFYRKSESYRMNDFNINYLSYWTDNGKRQKCC